MRARYRHATWRDLRAQMERRRFRRTSLDDSSIQYQDNAGAASLIDDSSHDRIGKDVGRIAEEQRFSRVWIHGQCQEELDIRSHKGGLTRRSFPRSAPHRRDALSRGASSIAGSWPGPGPHASEHDLSLREREY